MKLSEAETNCENLCEAKPREPVTFSKRDFAKSREACAMWLYFCLHYVLRHPFIELIELCQSKVHRPCPIGIIHTFELLKEKFPEHRFHYANQLVERYWKTTTEFR